MIKAIFFDIDGTLIPFGSKVMPESTYASLLKLQEKGIKIFIATGKTLAAVSKLDIMRISFDGYLTLNGQLCYDSELKMNFGYPIPAQEMEVLSKTFEADRIPFILIGEFAKYINFMNDSMLANLINTNDVIPDIGHYHNERVYQITACVNHRQREILENTLDYCNVTSWSENAIDIFCKGGGKMNALKNIMEIYHLKQDEIMAFGDAENDIQMLNYAKIGVAMGNGTDKCKEVANYITDDINQDGIMKALKHFELI